MEGILNTKGVTVVHAHPTPRDTTIQWRCAGHDDPEIFDPADEIDLAEALALCAGCEARSLCLLLGTSRGEWGVWGGVLMEGGKAADRVRQRDRRKRPAAA